MNKISSSVLALLASLRSRSLSKRYFAPALFATLIAGMFQGCPPKENLLQAITLVPGQTLTRGTQLDFDPSGLGQCGELHIDWGDGSVEDPKNINLTAHSYLHHTFTGWGGGKTVTAIGTSGCEGRVNTRFKIEPSVFKLAFGAGATLCAPVPGMPPPVPRTLVHITTIPVFAGVGHPPDGSESVVATNFIGIDFGCPSYGCVYDANGKPDSIAGAPFPFPGLREFSLVLRIGTQVVQGGKDVQFTTTGAGALEICLNDNNLSDNRGGYEIDIGVDQLGPP